MKKLKSSILIAIVLVLCLSTVALAANEPAQVYWQSDLPIGDGAVSHVVDYLKARGYDARSFGNQTAQTAVANIGNLYVFTNRAHGSAGFQLMSGQYLSGTNTKNRSDTHPLINTSLSKMRLAHFSGCGTGLTDTTYGFGNLPQTAVNRGAKCAVGYNVNVLSNWQSPYLRMFYRRLSTGNTVNNAHRDAIAFTLQEMGSYGGLDQVAIYGNASQTI